MSIKNKIERCNKAPTLCWDCANATNNFCPWAESGKPVDGWKAVPTTIKQNGHVVAHSYHVMYCPMFKRDAEYGGRKKVVYHLEYVPESRSRGRKMRSAIVTSIVGLMFGIEWLSLMILALWTFVAVGWLISEMGKHGAL